jgi:DDE superfamily endonuclease
MADSICRWQCPEDWEQWSQWLAAGLHARSRWRLPVLLAGILFAHGRRTVTTWLRAAGVSPDFQDYYYFLAPLGRKTKSVASQLLLLLLRILPLPDRLLAVIDDTPTKRYGPKVEGADIHHNPTPGPADQKYLYGHIWVTLSLAVRHSCFGALALPLLAMLYVRQKTMPTIPPWRDWTFATKLVLAARLVEWIAPIVKKAGKTLWIVVDGGYVKAPFLKRALRAGVTVIGRLRKDAALRDLPPKPRRGKRRRRGRPPKYGKHKISLAKRAAHPQGWQTAKCTVYGKTVVKLYKTFLATYRPTGGVIRVVIVEEDRDWYPFFSTDPSATAAEIIEAFADRATIEQDFHDVKEVWGAGQQQVRNIWTNVAVYHLNLWIHTLVELWSWTRPHSELCDRGLSPWDDAERRPSHADRRKALRQQIMQSELSAISKNWSLPRKILRLAQHLITLAT